MGGACYREKGCAMGNNSNCVANLNLVGLYYVAAKSNILRASCAQGNKRTPIYPTTLCIGRAAVLADLALTKRHR